MSGQRELAEALSQLVRVPEMLMSHVFIDYRNQVYVVKSDDGETLLVLKEPDLNGRSVEEAIRRKASAMICWECSSVLLDGEMGVCTLCESTAVMDLIRLGQSFE